MASTNLPTTTSATPTTSSPDLQAAQSMLSLGMGSSGQKSKEEKDKEKRKRKNEQQKERRNKRTQHMAVCKVSSDPVKQAEYQADQAKKIAYNKQRRAHARPKRKTMDLTQTVIQPKVSGLKMSSNSLKTRAGEKKVLQNSTKGDTITNSLVTDQLNKVIAKASTFEEMVEEASKMFVWFEKPRHFTGDPLPTEENKPETTTMWFHPSLTEYHAWVTVKESGLNDAGYGLFAERNFSKNDVITVYLGYHVDSDVNNPYAIDYVPKGKSATGKRVSVDGGFPEYRQMYLGAHMTNDPNWSVAYDVRDESYYNVEFAANLELVATKDIKAGEELYVDYNYKGQN